MSFELDPDEAIPEGIRRIVRERIDDALEALDGDARNVSDEAVHDARRRFKEIRATLRLVRNELGRDVFDRENRTFRNVARPLSTVRDAKVLIDSFDDLVEHFGRVKPEAVTRLRRELVQRLAATRKRTIRRDRAVPGIERRIRTARKRVRKWPLRRRGWKAIEKGLQDVYRKGRRAMRDVHAAATDAALHEWRKRAKDLQYELELLRSVHGQTIGLLVEQAQELTDLLGDDHDLAVLRIAVAAEIDKTASAEDERLIALIDARRRALQMRAAVLGEKVYQQKAQDFVRSLKRHWKTSRVSLYAGHLFIVPTQQAEPR